MNLAAIALTSVMSVVAADGPLAPSQRAQEATPLSRAVESPSAPHLSSTLGHVCFNAAETREKITQHRLAEPFRALRAGRLQGEALRAKLCRFKQGEFVYEVSVLRRDGHIVRLYMNAQNGQAIAAPNDADRN